MTAKIKTVRKPLAKTWLDNVHTDAVVFTFAALTKKNELPLSVQNRIVVKKVRCAVHNARLPNLIKIILFSLEKKL